VTGGDYGHRYEGGAIETWDESSGNLHRELPGLERCDVSALATVPSADGQQARLVVGSEVGQLRVYDPESGLVLHNLQGHADYVAHLATVPSSSAAPHHPRVVSASYDGTAKVSDVETGELLAELWGRDEVFRVMVWKEHVGGHDRIAVASDGHVTVWDGETFTTLHDIDCGDGAVGLSPFKSAEGPYRLLMAGESQGGHGVQMWDPEEDRLLPDDITTACRVTDLHLLESAEGRYLLAIVGYPWQPGDMPGAFLDVWDLGEAPTRVEHMRPAHKQG
jgi:WD40 repeat protein